MTLIPSYRYNKKCKFFSMKLIRFGKAGEEKPGIIIDDVYYDVSGLGEDYDETFFGTGGLQRLESFVKKNKNSLPKIASDTRLGSPVGRPSKIVCIGLNYADHARETNAAVPSEPVIFLKASSS